MFPFPLGESNLSGPLCYPVAPQIVGSRVNAFKPSPPCCGSKALSFSDCIIKIKTLAPGLLIKKGGYYFFSALWFPPTHPICSVFTYRLSIYQSAFYSRFTVVHFIKPWWIYVYLMEGWCREYNSLNKGVYMLRPVNNNALARHHWTLKVLTFLWGWFGFFLYFCF